MTSELLGGRPDKGRPTPATAGTPVTPDDPRLGAWRSLIQAHARLTRTLDEELQAAHRLSLAEYDALLQLANAPDRRLRMSALADRVLLSRSGITRLVDRLVAAGMVERSTCSTDARGAEAALTAEGLQRLREASLTHLDGVGRLFLDVIEAGDRAAVQRAMDMVLANLGGGTAADADCVPGSGRA
jgi:DNA-binding MarR family transcriptional regulator